MNNNNLRPQMGEWNSEAPYSFSSQKQEDKPGGQYSYQVHQPTKTNTNTRPEGIQQKYIPAPRSFDPEFKEKNRAMYNSSMAFGANNQSVPSLSAFARQVNQPVGSKEANDADKYLNTNNNDKYSSFLNKYAHQSSKNPKMASSAIFPDHNISNPAQFNRFPAFNIGIGSSTQQSYNSSQGSTELPKPHLNQTPQQRKQRQLMQIKKQLEQINKKMISNAEKNKNANNFGSDLRPPKPQGVSQSVIVDSQSNNYGQNYNQSPANKPFGGIQNLSTEPIYTPNSQYKSYESPKQIQQQYKVQASNDEGYSNPNRYNDKYSTLTTTDKYTNYSNSTSSSKPYQYEKKPEQVKKITPPSPTYDSTSPYKPQNNYKTQSQPQSNYGNYNVPNSASTSFNSAAQKISSFSKSNNTPIIEASSNYNYSKPTQDTSSGVTAFKKKKQPIVYDSSQTKKPEFFKKGNYIAESPIADLKKPVFHPETSSQSQTSQHHFGIRKTESVNYNDPTIPVQEVKKLKITDFIIGKKMGKGQFGEVMLVRHKATGFICGLKVMEKKQIRDQDYVGQIARELSIQFYLSHRNIAPLYGFFDDQKNMYLLVQFCTGGQLLQKLRGQRRMNEKDVSTIIKQVCEGVDYIHKQLIIHRDIKPQNILFNFGIVKISDFGWAVYRGFGMRKTASGSPLYYPPQIVKGEQYDDKIDVWNIGMMTYQCILGKIPFRVYTQMDLNRIVSDQITFPSYVDVTDEAKDFILKTMKKKGQQRMQIRQMLRHPFITKNQTNDFSQSILQEFRRVLE